MHRVSGIRTIPCKGAAIVGRVGCGLAVVAAKHLAKEPPKTDCAYPPGYITFSLVAHTSGGKKKLINRVRRLQGQIDAVEKALHEEQDCGKVLQLITAARGALNSLMAEILEGHVRFHIVNPDGKPKSKQAGAARELIAVVRTYLK
jgi:FrmR/RcnR family transcriptional regulator, repressor of frmRAB operon